MPESGLHIKRNIAYKDIGNIANTWMLGWFIKQKGRFWGYRNNFQMEYKL